MKNINHYQAFYHQFITFVHSLKRIDTKTKSESESLLGPSGLLNFTSVFSSINQSLQRNNKSVWHILQVCY